VVAVVLAVGTVVWAVSILGWALRLDRGGRDARDGDPAIGDPPGSVYVMASWTLRHYVLAESWSHEGGNSWGYYLVQVDGAWRIDHEGLG
jgi:hypothetical protein